MTTDHERLTKLRTEFENQLAHLATQRDEIRVKLHLAGADLRDEWAGIEKKWARYQARAHAASQAAGASADSVVIALKLLGDELSTAYHNVKQALSR